MGFGTCIVVHVQSKEEAFCKARKDKGKANPILRCSVQCLTDRGEGAGGGGGHERRFSRDPRRFLLRVLKVNSLI